MTAPVSRPPMRLAYFFTELPALEGTFPTAEIEAMADRGFQIEVFVLRSRLATGTGADRLLARFPIHRSGYLTPATLLATAAAFLRHPLRFVSGVVRILRDTRGYPNLAVKSLGVIPKCCLFARQVRRGRFDLVWSYWASLPGRAAWWISRFSDVPYGTWTHAGNDIYNRRHQTEPALKTTLRDATLICTCNQTNVEYFRTILPEAVFRRVVYQPHGIDLARFAVRAVAGAAGSATDVRPGRDAARPLRLLSVGRLAPAKGFVHAVEACARLRDRGRRVHYRIIGDGPMRGSLQTRINELGLESEVELPGEMPQSALPAEYAAADVFVMPSVVGPLGARDGLPNVLLEAMACGLPAVGSDAVGIPEAIRPGETGELAPPADPAGLADAIERIAGDPARAAAMADAARGLVEERYARAACMDQLAATFRRHAR